MKHVFKIIGIPNSFTCCDNACKYYLCSDGLVRDVNEFNDSTVNLYYFKDEKSAQEALNNYLKEQEPTMNTTNILKSLLAGNKIRHKSWQKTSYVHIVDDKIMWDNTDGYNDVYDGGFAGEGWEEVKPPLTLADLKPGQFARITGYKTDNKFIHIGRTAFCFGHAHHDKALQVVLVEYPSWVSPIVEGNEMLTKIECQLIDNPFAS